MCHDVADGLLDNWKFEVWYFAYFIFRSLSQQTYKILVSISDLMLVV